ncbi:hypothetical protein FVEN_g3496 [Fusarium venenatum]|nr:hypothetical protein FVEN_g3496 [Fusarium venenatum]
MRPDLAVVLFTLFSSAVASAIDGPLHIKRVDSVPSTDEHDLYKRRGGGGGGGRGGSSGGGSRGGSSGSRGSGSSSGSSGGRSGGRGPQPTYAGNRYAGGASAPYRPAGRNSPSGIKPVLLGAGIGGAAALAFWPGVWYGGAYLYHYPNSYRYYNESSEEDEERPILCACSAEAYCGCDQDDKVNNTALYDELIGNGSYEHLNKSIVDVAEVNGTTTILINGTLPNDTALPSDSEDSAAAQSMIQAMGYWPAAAAVLAAVLIA